MGEATGMVGAFWVLPGPHVIGEKSSLSEAVHVDSSYNGRSGHESLWTTVSKPVSFIGRGYSTVPRGRILYHADRTQFVAFAAPEIVCDPQARHAVEIFYNLLDAEHQLHWKTDPHYVTQPDIIDESDSY